MVRVISNRALNPTVYRMEIESPRIAERAEAGQFVILRADERSERIPLTVAECHRERGTFDVIYQVVGASTMSLAEKKEGDCLSDAVGPLGNPTDLAGMRNVIVVGGGVGCAIALPVACALSEKGARVTSVIGFRSRDLIILQEDFERCSARLFLVTDDGSAGEKGNVCLPLSSLLESGEKFDAVITIGPLVMMKFVAQTTKPYGIKTIASMNPIMLDGTGMCGCCRVTVGGVMKFACVDGPDFDAHLIDFDEAILRSRTYTAFEAEARERHCNLFRKEAKS